jgi:hypothetical protein
MMTSFPGGITPVDSRAKGDDMRLFSIGVALSAVLAFHAAGAEKAGRLSGSVVDFNKGKSEITIRQGSEGTARRMVEYTATTQFTMGDAANTAKATPGSADQVAVGNYLTCIGSWDGTKLAASRCTVRPSKKP